MSECRAELCEFWNGETCVCAAIEGDPDAVDRLELWVMSHDDD